jgi:Nucleotidyltransferase domain
MSEWPEVLAIAEGGSHATGNADDFSDVDLYVYSDDAVPVEERSALILPRSDDAEIDNRVWEPGDIWTDRLTGISVDIMYRTRSWMETMLSQVLDRHEASLGYSTCFWHNVLTSKPYFDRSNWFAELQKRAAQPYPEKLVEAIIAKNYPLLRDAHTAFATQISLAVERSDLVSVNHRTAAFLASYFDVLFALNRVPHPGEKRLVKLAAKLPLRPDDLAGRVTALLTAGLECRKEHLEIALNNLVDDLDVLLQSHVACLRMDHGAFASQ